jgi:hypothetical protein
MLDSGESSFEAQRDVDSCNQTLALYAKLFDMGFGLKELNLLWHIICEIDYANNIPREDAIRKFFKDVEDHYNDKLGFESKVGSMQEELSHLDQRKTKLLTEINAIPQLALAHGNLLSVDDNNGIEEIKLLVDQIRKAGGIKEATDKLTSQSIIGDRKSSVFISNKSDHNHNNDNGDDGETKTGNIEETGKARVQTKDDKDSNYNENPDKYTMVVPDMYPPNNLALPRGEEKEEKPKTRSGPLEEKENGQTLEQQIEEFVKGFQVIS